MLSEIQEITKSLAPRLIEIRRHIHAHPELSGQEYQTAAYVAGVLSSCGLRVQEAVGKTGVVGDLNGEKNQEKILAIRTDMDALPIQEKTDLSPILNPEIYQQLLRLGSKEVILQVYSDFTQECESLVQLLEMNPLEEPSEDLLRIIHTIKGNSGTLGAEKIYAAAKQSESLGRLQKRIEFTESLHYLKATLKEFQEYLNNPSF
jgi:HPt (histidine-containing phosphotransfer) domain-containing protein